MKSRRADTRSIGPSHLGLHAPGGTRTPPTKRRPAGFVRGLGLRCALSLSLAVQLAVLVAAPLAALPVAPLATLPVAPLATLRAAPRAAQSPADDMRLRVGATIGGIGLWGASVEFLWGSRSIDVNLATLTFKEVSLAVTGKQYFGRGDLRPFLGVGLLGIAGSTGLEGEQTGKILILRLPAGGDWNFTGRHYFGGSLAVNVGLWIDRADPDDDTPIERRPVPFPGLYYRVEP